MIALPNYLLDDKITTPNKAGTLKGVSPISSSRNVMVKVKDTASFIEAAIAVHGDKYDYSQTVYVNTRSPIVIVCKKCGPFTLSEPRSHLRLDKKCGCRACEQEETLQRIGRAKSCIRCGVRLKYCIGKQRKECMCSTCLESPEVVLKLHWQQWAKECSNRFYKEQRKKLSMSEWVVFAGRKSAIMAQRARLTPREKHIKDVKETTWTQWSHKQTKSRFRNPESPWQVKARRWVAALDRRSRIKPVDRKY